MGLNSRKEYYKETAVSYDSFQKHIHQEIRSRLTTLYWVARKEKQLMAEKARKEAKIRPDGPQQQARHPVTNSTIERTGLSRVE